MRSCQYAGLEHALPRAHRRAEIQSAHHHFFSGVKRQDDVSRASVFIEANILASARAAVDFAVPFSPRISMPPMPGSMASSSNANFMRSCPRIALKGKSGWRPGGDTVVIIPTSTSVLSSISPSMSR